jgi:hypothetical protein
MRKQKIDNSLENFFKPPQIGTGLLLIALGFIIMLSGGFAGIGTGSLILLLGGAICFSKNGIQIDFKNRRCRKYINLFYLIKIGSWQDICDYDYVVVKKIDKGYTAISLTTKRLEVRDPKYGVFLINKISSEKILIKSFDNKYIAMSYAKDISETTSFKFIIQK